MSRILHKEDFIEMCQGAILRSDGGDYPLKDAIEEIERIDKEKRIEIEMVDVDEMDEDLYAITIGKLGPVSTDAFSCHDSKDGIIVIKKMQEIMAAQGKKIGYLYTVEHDCIQLPYFLKVATAMGIPLLNADASGRSVPTLGNFLPIVYGHPISPCVYATRNGESIVIETEEPGDYRTMERIGRSIVVAYDSILIGYCISPLKKSECKECLVEGSLDSLQETGKALMRAKAEGLNYAEEVLKVFTGKFMFQGKVSAKEWECRDGFDFGKTTIDADDGNTYELLIQNENLAVRNKATGELLLTAPDSVGMICVERGEGISNDELELGMEL